MNILVINCGSSSIKFRLFAMDDERELASGQIERVGNPEARMTYVSPKAKQDQRLAIPSFQTGVELILKRLTMGETKVLDAADQIAGVGHRIVHGGDKFREATVINQQTIDGIRDAQELAPLHTPANLAGIEAAMQHLPHCPHVAVFDTAFFQTIEPAGYVYAVPYEWIERYRVRRYGFHGTSHRYITHAAAELLGKPQPNLITLHLGNGCSATCVRAGRAIDHSMGMTPLAGLVMGTRCGDLDPAIIFHLHRKGLDPDTIEDVLTSQSGLKGLSGISNDLRDIEKAARQGDPRAQLAIDVFVHRIRHYLGAYLLALGNCDAVVFTAGIGEHAADIRERVLADLQSFGIALDPQRNRTVRPGAFRISTDDSRVQAWVVPTNEELMIARDVRACIGTPA